MHAELDRTVVGDQYALNGIEDEFGSRGVVPRENGARRALLQSSRYGGRGALIRTYFSVVPKSRVWEYPRYPIAPRRRRRAAGGYTIFRGDGA